MKILPRRPIFLVFLIAPGAVSKRRSSGEGLTLEEASDQMGKADIPEKNVSRKSLIFLLSTLALLSITGFVLLFESAESPEPAQRARTSPEAKGATPLITVSGWPRNSRPSRPAMSPSFSKVNGFYSSAGN